MIGAAPSHTERMQSLLSWWQLAGVEDFCGDGPVNWLEIPAAPPSAVAAGRAAQNRSVPALDRSAGGRRAAAPEPASPPVHGPLPASLEALHDQLLHAADLAGTGYGGARALPHGIADAPLMVISDCPDADDLVAGTVLSAGTGTLLRNMLSAIGVDLAGCYRASLAVTRPASGRLPGADMGALADLMRHHIALVRPRNLLLLGSGASEALLDAPVATARESSHDFNQNGGRVALIATYHPRTLLKRPQCKRPAWEDLQMLLKEGRW